MQLKLNIPVREFGKGNVRDIVTAIGNYKYVRAYEDIDKVDNISIDEYRWYSVLDKQVLAMLLRDDYLLFISYLVTDARENNGVIGVDLEVQYE